MKNILYHRLPVILLNIITACLLLITLLSCPIALLQQKNFFDIFAILIASPFHTFSPFYSDSIACGLIILFGFTWALKEFVTDQFQSTIHTKIKITLSYYRGIYFDQ